MDTEATDILHLVAPYRENNNNMCLRIKNWDWICSKSVQHGLSMFNAWVPLQDYHIIQDHHYIIVAFLVSCLLVLFFTGR